MSTRVALRKESVDRNRNTPNKLTNAHNVALRKESVDRNWPGHFCCRTLAVALRKESVDRNYQANAVDQLLPVAPRKESVDRNSIEPVNMRAYITSLSARRAWIEIPKIL